MIQSLRERYNSLMTPEKKKSWGFGGGGNPVDQTGLTSQVVDLIIEQAIHERVSDIHLEPDEEKLRIRYRIDGRLFEVLSIENNLNIPVITRIEIMAGLQTDAMMKRKSQDGRFSQNVAGNNYDFRVATFPTIRGEKMAIRVLNENFGLFDLGQIGLDLYDQKRIDKLLNHHHGLLLVSGPTGSGKTTTLYAILNKINSSDINIITLEDPVEYKIMGMNQCDIRTRSDFKFSDGLKAVLRQDPDVILVGEVRDKETADIAIRAAISGHLVFSSIHANSSIGTVVRLVNMGLEPFMVSYSMIGAIAQRLVRKVCTQCKVEEPVNQELISHLKNHYEIDIDSLLLKSSKFLEGKKEDSRSEFSAKGQSPVFYKGAGCQYCFGTGYMGRVGIFEIVLFDEELRHGILRGANSWELQDIAIRKGAKTLALDALHKVRSGLTSLEEVYSILIED